MNTKQQTTFQRNSTIGTLQAIATYCTTTLEFNQQQQTTATTDQFDSNTNVLKSVADAVRSVIKQIQVG